MPKPRKSSKRTATEIAAASGYVTRIDTTSISAMIARERNAIGGDRFWQPSDVNSKITGAEKDELEIWSHGSVYNLGNSTRLPSAWSNRRRRSVVSLINRGELKLVERAPVGLGSSEWLIVRE
jgi:hypothetical protein